jgi:TrmH family RNA methyltransferase
MEEKITSRDNPMIVNAMKLVSSAKHRREQGLFFAEGMRLCTDAASSGVQIEQLFYTQEAKTKYSDAVIRLQQCAKRSFLISAALAEKLSDTKSPQGVFCVCKTLDKCEILYHDNKRPQCIIGLENIQDPSNMGTILRTAEALGLDGAILTGECCDVYSPKVLRGSMGAVFRLPVLVENDTSALLERLHRENFVLFASVPRDNAVKITDPAVRAQVADKRGAVVFVGNEGNGMTESTIAACDQTVTIPMEGRAESLNAAVAASILMWELVRK